MGESLPVNHEIFISYSTKDKIWADAACAVLEQHRIRCWIAPRDIIPGSEWGAAIIGGIDECKIMVLVFSANANESSQVRREVERAISKGIIVLPLRVENVRPEGAMEYALSNTHWLDAFTPPMEQQMVVLAESVLALLKRSRTPREPEPARRPGGAGTKSVPSAKAIAAETSEAAVHPSAKPLDRTDPARTVVGEPPQVAKLLTASAEPAPQARTVRQRQRRESTPRDSLAEASVQNICPRFTAYASSIWRGVGTLILLSLVISEIKIMLGHAKLFSDSSSRGAAAFAGMICFWVPGIPLGVLPIIAGLRSRRGKSFDIIGYGIISLILGPVVAVCYAFVGDTTLAIVTGLLLGLGLIIAGVMAIVGRKEYQEWRHDRMQMIPNHSRSVDVK